jgi:membrane protein
MPKLSAKGVWEVLKQSFTGFMDDKVTKLSASLAYYTIFSMGPLLIVIIFLCSFFFGREAIEGSIYGQIEAFVGQDTALQMQEIIKNASLEGKSTAAAIIGFVMLLVGATTVFAEIQDSINMIWGLKPKPTQKGWWVILKTRLLSFSLIISLGFLLLVSLAITTVIEGLNNRLQAAFPDIAVVFFYIFNLLVTIIVITMLFGLIFKVLPDARIRWKDVLAGSIVTALLFLLGKFAISYYISKSNIGSTYGAAGSLVVLLLWVYYSSIILYFGAEFTRAYAVKYGKAILPNAYAVTTKLIEVEEGRKPLQDTDEKKKVISKPSA